MQSRPRSRARSWSFSQATNSSIVDDDRARTDDDDAPSARICESVALAPPTTAAVPRSQGIGPIAIRLGPAVLATPDVALMPAVPRDGDADDEASRAARAELALARVEQLLDEMKIYRAPIIEELAVAFAEDAERDPSDPPASLMALLAQLGRCFDCDVMGRDGAGRVVYAYGGKPPPFVQAWLDARAAEASTPH